jgi:hypothetical protein
MRTRLDAHVAIAAQDAGTPPYKDLSLVLLLVVWSGTCIFSGRAVVGQAGYITQQVSNDDVLKLSSSSQTAASTQNVSSVSFT